ncbi:hypothetical protein EYF80_003158 [Liparis tanakae]|uniref:Uncharacterized protein n=1 Tax=Liparis tanakae TaxID=230148 RepID=A0A4Z2J9A9_9TELE|nr:hypothetical protein EYF80_003158 [Liparis tanakae]
MKYREHRSSEEGGRKGSRAEARQQERIVWEPELTLTVVNWLCLNLVFGTAGLEGVGHLGGVGGQRNRLQVVPFVGLDAGLVVFFKHDGFVCLLDDAWRCNHDCPALHSVLLQPGLVQGQALAPGAIGRPDSRAGAGTGSDNSIRDFIVLLGYGWFLQGCG